jgi:hypothetical protein
MATLRKEPKIMYKRLLRRAFVGALRAAYTVDYADDPQLTSLHIVSDFNIEQVTFPMIAVKFTGGFVQNVGVGHREVWDDGTLHFRYRWEGTIEFELFAQTPFDRDVLHDSLTEIIAFGKLDNLMANFCEYIYTHDFGLDYQIMLDESTLTDTGDSTVRAYWEPEDMLIFTGGVSLRCHGTFASVTRDSGFDTFAMVNRVTVYPYIYGYEDEPNPAPFTVGWDNTMNYQDIAYVTGEAGISFS